MCVSMSISFMFLEMNAGITAGPRDTDGRARARARPLPVHTHSVRGLQKCICADSYGSAHETASMPVRLHQGVAVRKGRKGK